MRLNAKIRQMTGAGWFPLLLLLLTAAAPAAADDAGLRPDFAGIPDIQARKVHFFRYLLPVVEAENERLARARVRLEWLHDHIRFRRGIEPPEELWLVRTAEDFGLDTVAPHEPEFWRELMLRVDTVPVELVLVQAALESAWGTSRFARQGNNFFGLWCFAPGCGMVPAARATGAAHEVASFDSVTESVAGYLRNLNTGYAYEDLRWIRADLRGRGLEPDAAAIAAGLRSYSERGAAYVQEVRSMLNQNADAIRAARDLAAAPAGG